MGGIGMNANELSDEFKNRKDWKLINYIHWSEQSETMLRQQQAEIEALKKESALQRLSDFTQEK